MYGNNSLRVTWSTCILWEKCLDWCLCLEHVLLLCHFATASWKCRHHLYSAVFSALTSLFGWQKLHYLTCRNNSFQWYQRGSHSNKSWESMWKDYVLHTWFISWFQHYIHCLLVYLACPLTSFFLYLFFLTCLLPYLPFPLRIDPLHFQAGGCKRWPNLGLSCFNLFWVVVFLCPWCMAILHCSKFSYLH